MGAAPYVYTLVWPNAVGKGFGVATTGIAGTGVGVARENAAAVDGVCTVIGSGVLRATCGRGVTGTAPGVGNVVPGASVGSGAGVGTEGNGGPNDAFSPGRTIWGVTVTMTSLRVWVTPVS